MDFRFGLYLSCVHIRNGSSILKKLMVEMFIDSGDVTYLTGMGLIRLRNHDGSTRVMTDVRGVPKLKKNFISLGALVSKGLIVIIQDGVKKSFQALLWL